MGLNSISMINCANFCVPQNLIASAMPIVIYSFIFVFIFDVARFPLYARARGPRSDQKNQMKKT